MGRGELERLSKEELIELVLRLQRPEKTSRTSSKPPSTDRKEQREKSKPGGAKPGHEGHSRVMSEAPDAVVEHRPGQCSGCGVALSADLLAETVSVHERVELPEVKPLVTHHRRLTVRCPACGRRVVAPVPEAARRSGRACMPSPLTLRRFRRCPTSGCRVPCPTCSGCISARVV
jgi:transposase